VAAVLGLLVGGAVRTEASITITTPAGLSPGDQFRIVFVTDGVTNATSSSIGTYDGVVNTDVSNAGGVFYNGQAVTNWLAIASTTSVNAIDHIGSSATTQVYLVNDLLVATSTTTAPGGLWSGGLSHAISADLLGASPPATPIPNAVWTGTNTVGTSLAPLGVPTKSEAGNSLQNDGGWILGHLLQPTQLPFHLYGISPVLTVAPEPSTAIVAVFGAVAFIAYGWSRHRRQQSRQAAA
jgi:hypothetical protein